MRASPSRLWLCRHHRLAVGWRPLVMGVVNVTPDSFSDGGRYDDPGRAADRALALIEEGADIVDVGGESTRPGAEEVPAEVERDRVVPVVRRVAAASRVPLSVDTRKALVARAALDAGACIVNDVSALTHDPAMAEAARAAGAGVILMHMRGTPPTMQRDPAYGDVAAEVAAYLGERLARSREAGLAAESLAVDPGIGFGKTLEHNLRLLARLDRLRHWGVPVVVGLSRKSFIGTLTGRPVSDRMAGSLGGLICAALGGADILRVHDVKESRDALAVAMAIREATDDGPAVE